MTTIQVATIEHRHGVNVYVARTEQALAAKVAAYCREWWDERPNDAAGDDEPPTDDDACIARYFDDNEHESLICEAAPLEDEAQP